MGIEIILYDSSPIIQKIFFHILYHYNPIVHRVDETSALIEKVKYSKPDIIFIDATLSKNNNLVNKIKEKKEELKKIPLILMSNTDLEKRELENISAQDTLKKPIEAESLRKLITRFVSKTKSNILSKHLEFPSLPNFIEEHDKQEKPVSKKPKPSDQVGGINPITEGEEKALKQHLEKSEPEEKESSTRIRINPLTEEEEEKALKQQPKESEPEEKESSTRIRINPITEEEEEKAFKQQPEKSEPEEKESSTRIRINPLTEEEEEKALKQQPEKSESEEKESSTRIRINPITEEEESKPADTEVFTTGVDLMSDTKILKQQEEEKNQERQEDQHFQEKHKMPLPKETDRPGESPLSVEIKNKIDNYIKTTGEQILESEIEKISKQKIQEELEKKIHSYQDTILKTIEQSVWQVIPELAKQIIKKELDKLLKEDEQNDE